MVPNTAFGKEVKKALIDRDESITWLANKVSAQTGKYVDVTLLRKIFIGERKAKNVRAAICDILELPEEVRNAQD